ncbi:hypothetical protein AGMMS4952_01020 [Spirochaetia bacterium]|nr:hypothetical protein AGMMS4952_01020 [Spirochaetia bacterium]
MRQKRSVLLPAAVLFAFVFSPTFLFSQDFGFGEEEGALSASIGTFAISLSGKAGMEVLSYVKDTMGDSSFDGGFRGRLNFEAQGANAKGIINLNVKAPDPNKDFFLSINEAYLQAYFGDFEIEGGIRKLTWGKADSMGPLDVINPYDYRSLTNLADSMELKLAQPMIHASYRIGSFTKIEAVALPWFSPHRFAEDGRWAVFPLPIENPSDMDTLKYAQAGARFTTTIGPVDIGAQYFYGRMYQPAVSGFIAGGSPPVPAMSVDYNRYHQAGVDYAQVIAGFNIRAEFGANITNDTAGDDGAVYNPSLVWSLGFDRDLFLCINLNLQCNESIRLMDDKVSDNPQIDTEAGSEITGTRITAVLSKKFLRDELETRITGIVGVEDKDFLIAPGIYWTIRDIGLEFSAGVFGGDKDGQLGQNHSNSFVKAGLTYTF